MRPKKQPLKLSYGSTVSLSAQSSRSRITSGIGAATGRSSGAVRRRQRRHRGDLSSARQRGAERLSGREDSDEDEREGTEEASEACSEDSDGQEEDQERVTEIKERMYLDKLANLKSQLSQLKQGIHPEYVQRLEQLEQQHQDRIHFAEVWLEYECQLIEAECQQEQLKLQSELEQRQLELREQLIAELEDKRRLVDAECASMDINGDTADVKQIPTRKLRRRPNDPAPVQDKRRKCGGVTAPVFLLEETQIDEDLLNISRNRPPPQPPQPAQQQTSFRKSSYLPDFSVSSSLSVTSPTVSSSFPVTTSSSCFPPVASSASSPVAVSTGGGQTASSSFANDVRIEDNKLFFERKWFHRGQPVFVEMSPQSTSTDVGGVSQAGCYSAVITAIQSDVVWVRKTSDNTKARISLDQLQSNTCSIKRRAS